MSDNSKWYYTDNTGAQVGPVPTSELKSLISEGRIPASGLAWTEGMDNWQSLNQIPALQNIVAAPPQAMQAAAPAASENPYKTPSARPNRAVDTSYDYDEYGGIRRLNYFLRNLLLTIATFVIAVLAFIFFIGENLEKILSPVVILGGLGLFVIYLIFSLYFALQRIRNVGYSGWFLLFIFVPLINSILSVALISLPEGFAYHKKLDIPAIILIGLNILLFIASFFVGYLEPTA